MFKIASVAILALSANAAFAQVTAVEGTAATTLNVNLAGTYEITVGQLSVTIDMNDPQHFINGNNSGSQSNHVQVSATGDYQVNVSAAADLVFGSESIPVNTVTVTPSLGDYLGAGTSTAPTMTLASTPLATVTDDTDGTTIITSGAGESLRGFHVVYAIPAAQASQYLNRPEGIYTTTVTYTLYSL